MNNAKKQRNEKEQRFLQENGDIKGIFQARMGTIKDRNGMGLTKAEDTKRWQEYIEELYIKDLHDQDNHSDVITHLEPDILECGQVGLRKHHYEQCQWR